MSDKRLAFVCVSLLLSGCFFTRTPHAIAKDAVSPQLSKSLHATADCGFPNSVRDGLSIVQYFHLAEIYILQFRLNMAKKCIEKLRRCQPASEAEKRAKILESTLLPLNQPDDEALRLIEKTIAADKNNRAESLKMAKECVERFPKFEWSYLLLGQYLSGPFGNPEKQSRQLYLKVLELNPKNVIALAALTDIASHQFNDTANKEALQYFQRLKAANPYYFEGDLEWESERWKPRKPEAPPKAQPATSATKQQDKSQIRKVSEKKVVSKQAESIKYSVLKPSVKPFWEKQYSFIDTSGKQVFEVGPNVDVVSYFREGLLLVNGAEGSHGRGINSGNGHTQYWKKNGDLAFAAEFTDGRSSSDGMLAFNKDRGSWGFANHNGDVVIAPKYFHIMPFSDELAAVEIDRHWGFINKQGQLVIEPIYTKCLPFSEGLAAVEIDGKVGFIDRNGHFSIAPIYDLARSFSEGLARVVTLMGTEKAHHMQYINHSGKVCLDINAIRKRYGGEIYEKGPDWLGFDIDSTLVARRLQIGSGKQEYDYYDFHDHLLLVWLRDKYGYVGPSGAVQIQPKFEEACRFSDGRAKIVVGGKVGYIDKQGDIAIKPKFLKGENFADGRAAVTMDGEHWGYIDTAGKMVIKDKFAEANSFSEGLAKVELTEP